MPFTALRQHRAAKPLIQSDTQVPEIIAQLLPDWRLLSELENHDTALICRRAWLRRNCIAKEDRGQ